MYASIFSFTLLIAIPVASAGQRAENAIKFRQSGYMFMRWNMGKIKNQVIKQPESYNKEQVLAAATVIAAVARSGIEGLFTPETSTGKGWKETRVRPEFFDNPDEVKKYTLMLRRNANALVTAANTGDVGNIKAQFKKVLDACKSCHKNFALESSE